MRAPNHLVIYLSGRCNLACVYCYARFKGAPISRKRLLAALDIFFKNGITGKKITFLGGEPALHPALLKAAVLRARLKAGRDLPIQVFTNGTMLTRSLLNFLSGRGVKIVLSLDGPASETDLNRRFKAGGGSVFSSAVKNAGNRENIVVSMVVTPQSALRLAENIESLLALGFKRLAWAPDISTLWNQRSLAELKKSALKAKAGYFKALRSGGRIYEIANIYEILKLARGGGKLPGCMNITLGPDGFFYPCDKIFAGGLDRIKRFRVGADGTGREKFFRFASALGAGSKQVLCAVAPWALRHFSPGGPGPQDAAALKRQYQARKTVLAWLEGMAVEGCKYPAFRSVHGLKSCSRQKIR
ncbi:MAG TPA: hypothetical protein DCL44_04935 [Elusimicrobia bacterium]|nr:hypothetical protein [Elusimicrobiota bacterium]